MVSLFGCERMSGDCCSSYFPQGDPWFWPSWDLIEKGIMENRRVCLAFSQNHVGVSSVQTLPGLSENSISTLQEPQANKMEREIVDDVAFIISLSDLGKAVFNSKK